MGGSHYRFIAIPEFFLFILKLVKLNKNLASFCHHPTLRDCVKETLSTPQKWLSQEQENSCLKPPFLCDN